MYAHQVIEDIRKLAFQSVEPAKLFILRAIELIKRSQKFHAGDLDDIDAISRRDIGVPLFMGDANLRLPYKLIWIDWTFENCGDCKQLPDYSYPEGEKGMHNSKEAVLVAEVSETTWQVLCFTYTKELNAWIPMLSSFGVYIGGMTDKNKSTFEMLSKTKAPGECNVWDLLIKGVAYPPEYNKVIGAEYSLNLRVLQSIIRILNCKNIVTEKIPAPERLNKKRRESRKQELFDYHVLNVVIPSKKREYHESTEPLSHNRVHLCRGHFKEYTAEHPLFGRLTGLYWWQPHVRGQNKYGIVMKDYKIKVNSRQMEA